MARFWFKRKGFQNVSLFLFDLDKSLFKEETMVDQSPDEDDDEQGDLQKPFSLFLYECIFFFFFSLCVDELIVTFFVSG